MHFRRLSYIPDLCPLAAAAPPVMTTKNVSRHAEYRLQGKTTSENHRPAPSCFPLHCSGLPRAPFVQGQPCCLVPQDLACLVTSSHQSGEASRGGTPEMTQEEEKPARWGHSRPPWGILTSPPSSVCGLQGG